MPYFRITLKRLLLDKNGRRVEPGMWAEVSHDKPYVNWAAPRTLDDIKFQIRLKYNIELNSGQIGPNNFEVTRIS